MKNELRKKCINIFPNKSNIVPIMEMEKYLLKSVTENSKERNEKKLEEKELLAIKKAKLKDLISVKEFELLYGYSKEAQKGFRNRVNDTLPYKQKAFGCKIQYKKIDVEDWISNQK